MYDEITIVPEESNQWSHVASTGPRFPRLAMSEEDLDGTHDEAPGTERIFVTWLGGEEEGPGR